ncbi:hypothetical protein IK112_02195 [Candidatus Saccharibacteria bacterium]|nr:hypothetical protein [Candidatus Saccharibacteria bacterium]
MVFDISKVGGIGGFTDETVKIGEGDDAETVEVYRVEAGDDQESPKAFLVIRKNTLELRTDEKLRDLLKEKYESVMESRYFGRGGIEIVNSGQLAEDEMNDLVRLSYNLSKEK